MVPKREEHTQREKAVAGNSGGMLVPHQEIANSNTCFFSYLCQYVYCYQVLLRNIFAIRILANSAGKCCI